ncbi:FecR family protein [Hyphomicrobium sulfonivorans]|uniref:FecR family protein n=1 Tax=Hyphomicrobium sulfonivorans TaxID=121290 RepID=UPI001570C3EF|nr:FecR family protein [Hyphomicrobium sulfonivorans]MBI1650868.1 FecR family protein [Hyphomicrobium sulfonivorans]NSL72751.1 Fe2+-dicitrate sensor, membrane component [Hyphomicrobium sulfonivorans]
MDQKPQHRPGPDEVAMTFLARVRATSSNAERAELEAWLAASPSHRAAWARAVSMWEATQAAGQRVADEEAAALAPYLKKINRSRAAKKRRNGTAAVAFVIAVGAAGLWLEQPSLLQNFTADYTSNRGERRLVTLPDSSTVLLDSDSAIDVDYSDRSRRIRLLRGNAFFAVTANGLPFTVAASDGEVRVLGTQFGVKLSGDGAIVTLEQGAVEVDVNARSARLAPGEQVRFARATLGAVGPSDLDADLGWRDGRLLFYDKPLSEVIAEIARYRPGRIVVANPALGDRIVSGSVPLDDPDAALRSLQSSVGFSMRSIAGRLVLVY